MMKVQRLIPPRQFAFGIHPQFIRYVLKCSDSIGITTILLLSQSHFRILPYLLFASRHSVAVAWTCYFPSDRGSRWSGGGPWKLGLVFARVPGSI